MTMHPVMNDTKWDEVRVAMHALEPVARWRTRDRHSGYVSHWDADWYYHFRTGGYEMIEWVEIRPDDTDRLPEVVEALRRIGVPGRIDDATVTIYGYVAQAEVVHWL